MTRRQTHRSTKPLRLLLQTTFPIHPQICTPVLLVHPSIPRHGIAHYPPSIRRWSWVQLRRARTLRTRSQKWRRKFTLRQSHGRHAPRVRGGVALSSATAHSHCILRHTASDVLIAHTHSRHCLLHALECPHNICPT